MNVNQILYACEGATIVWVLNQLADAVKGWYSGRKITKKVLFNFLRLYEILLKSNLTKSLDIIIERILEEVEKEKIDDVRKMLNIQLKQAIELIVTPQLKNLIENLEPELQESVKEFSTVLRFW